MGELEETADVIIDYTHINAGYSLFGKYVEDLPPHNSLFDDEIFEKDEVFSLRQFILHRFEHILAYGEIFGICAPPDREAAGMTEVARLGHDRR